MSLALRGSPLRPPPAHGLAPGPSTHRPRCRQQLSVRMGNSSATGPFTPLVIVTRNIMGKKDFNALRGKAISLHSQVIKDFAKSVGAESKQAQGLIKLAKQNGSKLGFLS